MAVPQRMPEPGPGSTAQGRRHPGPAFKTGLASAAYVLTLVSGLVVLAMADKQDKFTRFHAIQAIGLGALLIVAALAMLAFHFLLTAAGLVTLSAIAQVTFVMVAIVAIVLLAVKAYNGDRYRIPVIGSIAERNA
jgi:uncharacterized membrane protein